MSMISCIVSLIKFDGQIYLKNASKMGKTTVNLTIYIVRELCSRFLGICKPNGYKGFSSLNASTGSQETPKKVSKLESEGKNVQSPSKVAIWNRHIHKLKNSISQLLKELQSSITTLLKCSEDSYYGIRIRVSKSSDFPFPSYGPRPFSDLRFIKNTISQLLKGVKSSITTSKCSE